MATGWAGDGAVQDQIDATIKDGIERVRSQLPQGSGLSRCEECDDPIPKARRKAVPGVRLCVSCQEMHDDEQRSVREGLNYAVFRSIFVSRLPRRKISRLCPSISRLFLLFSAVSAANRRSNPTPAGIFARSADS